MKIVIFSEKQIGGVQIKMLDDNGSSLIDSLYNALFAPDLWNWIFSIVVLINLGHSFFFHKSFSRFYLVMNNKKRWHYSILFIEKYAFLYKQRKSQNQKSPKRNFSGNISSDIKKHVHNITTCWRHWWCLVRYLYQCISWPFLHVMPNINNQ